MNIHAHGTVEAGIIMRDLKGLGFDLHALSDNSLFRTALSEYGACRMTFDGLVDIAEKLAKFNPTIKPPTAVKERP